MLAVHSLTLSGAAEGMKFYLVPSMDSIRENGFGSLVTDAMNQAFFTLSLGIAAMEIFGSYMSDEHTLPGEAVRICALDTFVALMAGTIIFPACFTFGVDTGQRPLPDFPDAAAGLHQHGGRALLGRAVLPVHDLRELLHRCWRCLKTSSPSAWTPSGSSRRKAVLINGILIAARAESALRVRLQHLERLSVPSSASDVLDSEDFLVSNLLLPIGSLVYLLFCVTKWGWGFDKYLAEANKGTGLRFARWLKPYFQWVLPILIVIILLQGL